MKTFKLLDGSEIPWIAFGTGTAYYKKSCKSAVELALSMGFTHIDTAAIYKNEEDVGLAISSSGVPRASLYITTKLDGIPDGGTVEDSLRKSLKRLQLDYVDLYLVHAPGFHLDRPGGVKKVWQEMVEVKAKGLTRSIGVSNFNIKYLEEIMELRLEKPVVNQMEYHVLVAERLQPLVDFSAKHNILTAAWGALIPLMPDRLNEEIAPVVRRIKSTLDEIVEARGAKITQNQILFKWLQAKNIIAVSTSTKEWRLEEYLEVDTIADLTQEEIEKIERSTGGAHYRFYKMGSYIDENSVAVVPTPS